jgi:hypothetical protein
MRILALQLAIWSIMSAAHFFGPWGLLRDLEDFRPASLVKMGEEVDLDDLIPAEILYCRACASVFK